MTELRTLQIETVWERILKGESVLIIKESLKTEGWKESTILKCLTVSYKRLEAQVQKDIPITIATHIERYESIYAKSLGKARTAKHFLIANYSYLDAIESLFRKERVLGLHMKRTNIQVNNTKNKLVVETPIEKKYDFSKLTLEEKIEIRNLIAKTKQIEVPVLELPPAPVPTVILDNKAEILRKHGL